MYNDSTALYPTPFSKAYWREAVRDFRRPRTLAFAAMMIAVCIGLSKLSIPLYPGIKISFGFLGRALCAVVGGPVTALVFSVAEDNLSFFLANTGDPYFPGYTITTMLGTLIYALFLYRTRVTVLRVFLAKLSNNVLNVLLGSLWSAILNTKSSLAEAYITYVAAKTVTNTIQLPVQTLMLVILLESILPILCKIGFSRFSGERRLPLV